MGISSHFEPTVSDWVQKLYLDVPKFGLDDVMEKGISPHEMQLEMQLYPSMIVDLAHEQFPEIRERSYNQLERQERAKRRMQSEKHQIDFKPQICQRAPDKHHHSERTCEDWVSLELDTTELMGPRKSDGNPEHDIYISDDEW